jgi:hypothetical protein
VHAQRGEERPGRVEAGFGNAQDDFAPVARMRVAPDVAGLDQPVHQIGDRATETIFSETAYPKLFGM